MNAAAAGSRGRGQETLLQMCVLKLTEKGYITMAKGKGRAEG